MSNSSNSSPTEDDSDGRRLGDLSRDLESLLTRLAESREAIVQLLAARSVDEGTVARGASEDEETFAEEGPEDEETFAGEARPDFETEYAEPRPLGPIRALRRPMETLEAPVAASLEPEAGSPEPGAPEAAVPTPESDVHHQLPSSLRRPGPPALELALIYRDLARTGGELWPEAGSAVADQPEREGPKLVAEPQNTGPVGTAPGTAPLVKLPAPRKAPARLKKAEAPVKRFDAELSAAPKPTAARRRLLAVVLTAVGAVVLLTTLVSLLPSLL